METKMKVIYCRIRNMFSYYGRFLKYQFNPTVIEAEDGVLLVESYEEA